MPAAARLTHNQRTVNARPTPGIQVNYPRNRGDLVMMAH